MLTSHVIEGGLSGEDVLAADGTSLETLSGATIDITVEDGAVLLNGVSTVIATDNLAGNGVVHVIDTVLTGDAAGGDAADDSTAEDAAGDIPETIAALAVSNENFTTLVALVQEAGLVPALSDLDGTYTVFAPNNAAFDDLFAAGGITIDDLLANPDLATVLTSHVVEGEITGEDALAADGTSVETLSGATIDITVVDGAVVLNGVSTVIAADNLAGNSVVHVIDTVLTGDAAADDSTSEAPAGDIPATIAELASSNENFTTLVAAVQEAGLVPALSDEGTYTVFAPTNAAFDDLFAAGGITVDDLLANPDLATVLTSHVIDGEFTAEDAIAADGTSVETLSGATIDITVVDGAVVLNGTATVTTANLLAGNGVVHVIDAVLQ